MVSSVSTVLARVRKWHPCVASLVLATISHGPVSQKASGPWKYNRLDFQLCSHVSSYEASLTQQLVMCGLQNVLILRWLPAIQLRTTVLSVQTWICGCKWRTSLQWLSSRARTSTRHSSSRGMVSIFSGATLVLAITSHVMITPWLSSALTYTTSGVCLLWCVRKPMQLQRFDCRTFVIVVPENMNARQ